MEKILSTDSSLLNNEPYQLTTSQETVWISTFGNLQSFDGEAWTFHELPEGTIQNLETSPNGEIWVSYYSGEFSRWKDGLWTHFQPDTISELPDETVYEIGFSNDGTVWLAFKGAGVASYDGNQWSYYQDSILPSEYS